MLGCYLHENSGYYFLGASAGFAGAAGAALSGAAGAAGALSAGAGAGAGAAAGASGFFGSSAFLHAIVKVNATTRNIAQINAKTFFITNSPPLQNVS